MDSAGDAASTYLGYVIIRGESAEDAAVTLIAEVNEVVLNIGKKYVDDLDFGRPASLKNICDGLQNSSTRSQILLLQPPRHR